MYLDMLDQVQLSAVDLTLHGPQPFTVYFPHGDEGHMGKRTLGDLSEYGKGSINFGRLVKEICDPLSIIQTTEMGVVRSLSFEHLSSYPAVYHGYLFSLAVARRIWHKKFKSDPLNASAGRELATIVLSQGAACDPRILLEQYLGDKLDDIDVWA